MAAVDRLRPHRRVGLTCSPISCHGFLESRCWLHSRGLWCDGAGRGSSPLPDLIYPPKCDRFTFESVASCETPNRRDVPEPDSTPQQMHRYFDRPRASRPQWRHRSLRRKFSAYLPGCGQTAMCGDGRYARLLYVRRAQRTYSVRSLIHNPLERARTEVKLAPGFLVRSAPKPRRVVDRVGA